MPLTAAAISAAIFGADPSLNGPSWPALVGAVSTSLVAWAPSVQLQGIVTGTASPGGAVTGKFRVSVAPITTLSSFGAVGLLGPTAPRIAAAIGIGTANALNTSAEYRGASTGAVGADVSKVKAAPGPVLTGLIAGNLSGLGLSGPEASLLAGAIGSGIALMVLAGQGTGTAVGAGSALAGTGTSLSRLR
jgi:hypothetical protein